MRRRIALAVALICTTIPVCAGEVDAARGARLFRERVAPVLEARCVSCHSGDDPKGKLGLTTASAEL